MEKVKSQHRSVPQAARRLAAVTVFLDLIGATAGWSAPQSGLEAFVPVREAEPVPIAEGLEAPHGQYSFAVDGDTVAIDARHVGTDVASNGLVDVFRKNGSEWVLEGRLGSPDHREPHGTGHAIALDGDLLAMAVPGGDPDRPGGGALDVFTRAGGVWEHSAWIDLPQGDGGHGGEAVRSVALDGDLLVAGVPQKDGNSGGAYVFERQLDGSWIRLAELRGKDTAAGDELGGSVAVAGDTVVVGSRHNDSKRGAVYVYTRGSTWTQVAKLTAPDGAANDQLGLSVALDAGTLAVGSPFDGGNGLASGSLYVFRGAGSEWTLEQKLLTTDGGHGLGQSIALDGSRLVAGVRQGGGGRSVCSFTRSGGAWTQTAKRTASDDPLGYAITFALALTENVVALPDLVVAEGSLILLSDFAEPGAVLSATYRVKNAGDGTSETHFRDNFYLSSDDVLDADDVFLDNVSLHTAPIAPGSRTRQHTREVRIPAATAFGRYYVLIMVDGDNAVSESDETNNVTASAVLTVDTSQKDLLVRNVRLPSTTLPTLRSVTVRYEVVNLGLETVTEDWREVMILSADPIPDPSDTVLRYSAVHRVDLAGGDRRVTRRAVVIPRVEAGDYYLLVWTDCELLVDEHDEENNWASIEVTVYEGEDGALPDLVISQAALSSTTVDSGTSMDVSVSYTVTNVGEKAMVDPFRNTFFLSADDVLDAADLFLRDSIRHTTHLPERGGFVDGGLGLVVPNVTAGDYYVLVAADGDPRENVAESDEDNNVVPLPITVAGVDGESDMTVDKVRLSTHDASAGERVDLIYEVVNRGSSAVDPGWLDTIYLSADPVLDADDTFLSYSHRHTFHLAPYGGRYDHVEHVVVPDGLGTGIWYVLVHTDDEGVVAEADETNNVGVAALRLWDEETDFVVRPRAWATGVDLVPHGLILDSPTVHAGTAVRLDYTVTNQGVANTHDPWYDAVHLSVDEILDEDDTLLFFTHRHQVAVSGHGGTYGHGGDVAVPSATVPGDYFMIVEVDGQLSVPESNEANNTAAVRVTVGPSLGLPDLRPELPEVSETTLAPGQGVSLAYDSVNVGMSNVTTRHWDRYYLSRDATLDGGDALLGYSLRSEEDVRPGARRPRRRQVQIPYGTAAGDYHVLVKADGLDLVEEEDETDNVAGVAVSVQPGSGMADLVVDNLVIAHHGIDPGSFVVSYNSVNVGDGDMTMSHQDGFYLSRDAVLDPHDVRLALSKVYDTDLGPSAFEHRTQVVTIPAVSGPHYLLIVADDVDTEIEIVPAHKRVAEIDETNNLRAVPIGL